MSDSALGDPARDRDQLFGILAVQMGFVSREQLDAVTNVLARAERRHPGELLQEQGALTPERRGLLDALVDEYVRARGGDLRRSLEAATAPSTVRVDVDDQTDTKARATLATAGITSAVVSDARSIPFEGMRYAVLRQHARGGLGVLSVAKDAELGREVILKEMLAEVADDSASRDRFVREAEVTGGLEHPGIVPVYGLGRYADGRPYYAMRLVRGESLEQAINSLHGGLTGDTLRGLLTRFVVVCNAVAYAHSRGILHRDIKPANVMLGPYGETLVVDWGLAKVIGSPTTSAEECPVAVRSLETSGSDGQATRAGSLLGTPPYMSPEQASGQVDALGPTTDVYCLGATLYTVLTGRLPVRGANPVETLEKVCRGDWPPPRQLDPSVPAALDAVCRKAMALKPADRYGSALDLAADIERWLADEPVTAWREPWLVRTGRRLRRHRTLVAAAVVALLLGGAGFAWQQRVQARQRRDQDQRRAIAEAALQRANDALVRNRWAEARAALQQAEDRLPEEAGELPQQLEATRQYLDLVRRLDDIRLDRSVRVQGGHFDRGKADRDYKAAFRAAGLGTPDDDEAEAAARVAKSRVKDALVAALDDWADVASGRGRAWALGVARRADPDPARDRLRDPIAWEDRKTLAKRAREVPVDAVTPGLAAAVGGQLARLGEGEEILRTAQARQPGDFWLNYSLGYALSEMRRPGESEGFMRAAMALRPDNSAAHNGLAVALEQQGKLKQATAVVRHAVELDPGNAAAQTTLGWLLARQGQLSEAEPALRKAIELDPKSALAHADLGWALTGLRRFDEARAALGQALELDPKEGTAHDFLGWLQDSQGHWVEAAASYRKAIECNPQDPWPSNNLGWLLDRQGKLDEAERMYRKALELDPGHGWSLNNLGWLLDRKGKPQEAADLYRKSVQADPGNAWALNNLAWLLERQGNVDEAVPLYQKAVIANPSLAMARANLARALLKLQRFPEAGEAARRALALFRTSDPDRLAVIRYVHQSASPEQSAADGANPTRYVGPAENIDRAERARARRRFAEAACLAADAFSDDPNNTMAGHRYMAACAAALAGCGQGEDAPTEAERPGWRRPALTWLRSDLAVLEQRLNGSSQERSAAAEQLRHWLADPDLAGVRDAAGLATFLEPERKEWQSFWAKVNAALAKAPAN
jgi:serine/threonine-protein kinase